MQISFMWFEEERSGIALRLNLHFDLAQLKPNKQVPFRSNSGFFLSFSFSPVFKSKFFSLFVFTGNRFLQYYTNWII